MEGPTFWPFVWDIRISIQFMVCDIKKFDVEDTRVHWNCLPFQAFSSEMENLGMSKDVLLSVFSVTLDSGDVSIRSKKKLKFNLHKWLMWLTMARNTNTRRFVILNMKFNSTQVHKNSIMWSNWMLVDVCSKRKIINAVCVWSNNCKLFHSMLDKRTGSARSNGQRV